MFSSQLRKFYLDFIYIITIFKRDILMKIEFLIIVYISKTRGDRKKSVAFLKSVWPKYIYSVKKS